MKQFSHVTLLTALSLVVPACGGGDGGATNSIDKDGDGVPDSLGRTLDEDGDGVPDEFTIGDSTGIGVDTDGDGKLDAVGIDTDGDGVVDGLDKDGDGKIDDDSSGGDGDGTGGNTSTGGGSGDGDGDGDSPMAPTVVLDKDVEVAGFASSATATTDAPNPTYQWSFVSVPPDSDLEDGDLAGDDEATVSFTPDLGGDYVLSVKVTSGGLSTTEEVTIKPKTFDIPFVISEVNDADGASEVISVVKSGGESIKQISCVTTDDTVGPENWGEASTVFSYAEVFQRIDLPDSVNDPARIVANAFTGIDDNTDDGFLLFANSNTTCSGSQQPVRVNNMGQYLNSQPMRFSPDGKNIVMADTDYSQEDDPTKLRVVDSSSGALTTIVDLGDEPSIQANWLDSDTVIWWTMDPGVDPGSADDFGIVYTSPIDSPSPTKLFDCKNAAQPVLDDVRQLEIIDGNIYVAIRISTGTFTFDYELWRLRPNNSGVYACDKADGRNSRLFLDYEVLEFQLDAFGENVIFSGNGPGDAEPTIYVAPEDEGQDPVRVSPVDGATHSSMHWALGGRQFIWTSLLNETLEKESATGGTGGTETFTSPAIARIYRANADGSNVTVIWESDTTDDRSGAKALLGTNRGICSYVPGPIRGFGGLFALVLLGAALHRRRRTA